MYDTIIINLSHKCGTQQCFLSWINYYITVLNSRQRKVESKHSPHWDQSPQLDHSLLHCQISKIQHVCWQGQLLLIFQLLSGMTPCGDCMEILMLWHQFLHPCYKLFPFLIRKFIQHEEVSFFIWRNQFCQFWKAFFSSLSLFPFISHIFISLLSFICVTNSLWVPGHHNTFLPSTLSIRGNDASEWCVAHWVGCRIYKSWVVFYFGPS